jgi:actin-related protein
LFDKLKKLFMDKQDQETDDKYILVPESEMNENLKRDIVKLEEVGEAYSENLQHKYRNKFERDGKHNLKIWVCRDIDGDQLPNLSSEQCLEKEYRSQVAINFDGFTDEEDAYVHYIQLWYYFSGYFKGTGTLYDLSKNHLEADIEEKLKGILEQL